jgi:hypothetical protein
LRSCSVAAALLGLSCAGGTGVASPPDAIAVVEGLVLDLDSEPIEGAQVFTADETVGALTDERGAYRFELTVPGTYEIKAVRDGFTRDSVRVTLDAPSRVRADFVLGEAPVCQGPCFDRLGNPIACC